MKYTNEEQKALYELSKQYLEDHQAQHPASSQAADLRKLLSYHEWRYYILNDPVLSDYEYDMLFKKLEALEQADPALIHPDSPTQRVSTDLSSDFDSVPHLRPMLSLANSYNAEDLKDFDEQIKRLTLIPEEDDIEYVVEPKYDGGSIALVYEDDLLNRGATRGNGTVGEEMTRNARVIRSIPLRAAFHEKGIYKAEMRGEVVIRKDIFEKMNKERAAEGLSLFANSRNTAAGGLRVKDPKDAAKRGLVAFVYELGYAIDKEGNDVLQQFATHSERIEWLNRLGFKVPVKETKVCKNIQEVAEYCLSWEAKREAYPFEIDGMVVKVNDRELQERSGFTSHHPRWAIAYKFKAKQATTKLENVEYQVGKIGSITPVAKVSPVPLAGVTISSISLHNADFIEEKDLRLGDTVLIERAGDVIPYIVKPMEELRDGSEVPITFPATCPINTTEQAVDLVRVEGEAAWRCPNCVCGAQDLQRMIFHVSKPAMDIDGFGKSIVERFFELGWLRNLADIYDLDYEQISQLEGFGEKSVANLKAAINEAKQNPIYRLLHSLSIHHLGQKASRLLAAEIDHVLDLADWTLEDYTNIKDVGPIVAENVMNFFAQPSSISLLKELEANGVNLRQTKEDLPKAAVTEGPFVGKTILFTGSLQTMSRKEAQEKATAAGAKNISAVSANLNILVVGEKAGSKLKKAQALNTVTVLTEAEFLEKLDSGS